MLFQPNHLLFFVLSFKKNIYSLKRNEKKYINFWIAIDGKKQNYMVLGRKKYIATPKIIIPLQTILFQ